MDFFETLENINYQRKRFQIPIIALVIGIILLYVALTPEVKVLNNGELLTVEQSKLFLYGAILFCVGGVIWILYVLGVIKTILGYGIMTVMVIASVWLLYEDYMTVDTDVKYMQRYSMIDNDIKARMLDLKAAESAYKEFYKHYTNNMDTLIWFVKNGKKMSVPNIGKLPERRITPEERDYIYKDNRPIDKLMTEREANALAHSPNPPADLVGFSRDTVYLPVLDAIFYDKKHQTNRDKMEPTLKFHPDSLRYVPFSQMLVKLDTSSVQKGDITVPTLMIQMIHPMDSTKIYQIGDLLENHLRDNWSR